MTKAGYKQAIWTEVFFGGGMRDVHFFTPGTYYGAYIPKWGFVYVPNSKTQGAAIAAITEQVLDRYGNKSLIAAWAGDGFPMTSIDVPEFDQDSELDPNKFNR